MIHSSILMTAGYLSIALSQFRLSVLFGLLCANTIIVALLSDLFVTPWVLLTWRKPFRHFLPVPNVALDFSRLTDGLAQSQPHLPSETTDSDRSDRADNSRNAGTRRQAYCPR